MAFVSYVYLHLGSTFQIQSNAIKGEKIILEFSEIFPINGTFYNGNIGENNQFILDFLKIFPFNGFRLYTNYSPVHVIFVDVIFLGSGNFPSFWEFLRWKITCTNLCFCTITRFLLRVFLKHSELSIEKILLYKISFIYC